MKIQVFGAVAIAGMALTSAIVWSSTDARPRTRDIQARPAPASNPSLLTPPPVDTPTAETPPPVVDRSTFTAGKTLMIEGRLGHAVVPSTTDSETYVFLDITADANKVAANPAPLELAIVIDRSGSMRGKRLQNAVDAARTAIERLRDGDIVSVLSYNTRTEVVIPTTVIDAQTRSDMLRRIKGIQAKGDTCISCAVETGMRMLGRSPNRVSRILLLSDGEATRGVKDVEGFGLIADRSRSMGVSITSIGVDLEYNERIMAALARRSNGRHYFVESAVHLADIFAKEMQSLEQTVAANAELQVELAPGVFLDHVYDRTFQPSGNGITVPLGTFTAGDAKTLLMRVRVPRGQDGERAIADVKLVYTDLVENQQGHCDGVLIAQATSDPSKVSPLDGLVSMRISRSETAEALQQANVLFNLGREAEARGLLSEKQNALESSRRRSRKATPTGRAWDLDRDFEQQNAALGDAANAFDEAAKSAGPGKASSSSGGRKQVRRNQEAAVDLFE